MIDITPFIDDLFQLNLEDRQLVTHYYSTWTEQYPPYYHDGDTMTQKIKSLFRVWLELLDDPTILDRDDVIEFSEESIRDYVNDEWELDPKTIVDVYRGIGDNELFQDLLDEYLVDPK